MFESINFTILCCPRHECHALFALPEDVVDRLRNSKQTFCCPFGHNQSYGGETESARLRGIVERKDRIIADKNKHIESLTKKPKKKAVKKVKK